MVRRRNRDHNAIVHVGTEYSGDWDYFPQCLISGIIGSITQDATEEPVFRFTYNNKEYTYGARRTARLFEIMKILTGSHSVEKKNRDAEVVARKEYLRIRDKLEMLELRIVDADATTPPGALILPIRADFTVDRNGEINPNENRLIIQKRALQQCIDGVWRFADTGLAADHWKFWTYIEHRTALNINGKRVFPWDISSVTRNRAYVPLLEQDAYFNNLTFACKDTLTEEDLRSNNVVTSGALAKLDRAVFQIAGKHFCPGEMDNLFCAHRHVRMYSHIHPEKEFSTDFGGRIVVDPITGKESIPNGSNVHVELVRQGNHVRVLTKEMKYALKQNEWKVGGGFEQLSVNFYNGEDEILIIDDPLDMNHMKNLSIENLVIPANKMHDTLAMLIKNNVYCTFGTDDHEQITTIVAVVKQSENTVNFTITPRKAHGDERAYRAIDAMLRLPRRCQTSFNYEAWMPTGSCKSLPDVWNFFVGTELIGKSVAEFDVSRQYTTIVRDIDVVPVVDECEYWQKYNFATMPLIDHYYYTFHVYEYEDAELVNNYELYVGREYRCFGKKVRFLRERGLNIVLTSQLKTRLVPFCFEGLVDLVYDNITDEVDRKMLINRFIGKLAQTRRVKRKTYRIDEGTAEIDIEELEQCNYGTVHRNSICKIDGTVICEVAIVEQERNIHCHYLPINDWILCHASMMVLNICDLLRDANIPVLYLKTDAVGVPSEFAVDAAEVLEKAQYDILNPPSKADIAVGRGLAAGLAAAFAETELGLAEV